MKLETQKFLREYGLDELTNRFALKAVRHEDHENLILFKYNQVDSPMHEAVVRECRDLILNEAEDWRIVAFPYEKFFNLGEAGRGNRLGYGSFSGKTGRLLDDRLFS